MQTIQRITAELIKHKKLSGEKVTMLTAYDYPFARLIDQAGIDIVLVGDSLANVVLGLEATKDVGMTEMLHHAKAVVRAVKHALVIGDMPFEAYQQDTGQAVINAKKFIEEAGCHAVKLEWFDRCLEVAESIVNAGIPVMGHVGLTPQTADMLGGMKVQGKDAQSAQKIIERASALEDRGCFSIVLECIPNDIAKIITDRLKIPTIGIGAGVHCDGQVLVTHDILGLHDSFKPKFVHQYVDLSQTISESFKAFSDDVKAGRFPDEERSFHIKPEEIRKLPKELLSSQTNKKPAWYFKASTLVIGFMFIGPFILPIVWFNPNISKVKKTIYTIIIAVISFLLFRMVLGALEAIQQNDIIFQDQIRI